LPYVKKGGYCVRFRF